MADSMTLMWPCCVTPRIVRAGRYPLDVKDFRRSYMSPTHALHLHEYAGRIRLGKRELALQPGDLTLSRAEQISSYALPKPGWHLCIHFEPLRLTRPATALPCHIALGPRRSYVAQQLQRVIALFSQADSPGARGKTAAAAAGAGLQALLLEVAMGDAGADGAGRRRLASDAVHRVAQIIHDRYPQPLTVNQLADAAGLSRSYLAREFRRRYGMTMQMFLRRRRMEAATQLLRTTELPIKAIARQVGVDDLYYFHRQFRQATGATPRQVRQDPVQRKSE